MKEKLDNPKRINFFSGRLLDADDLSKEQDYYISKMRRHNLYLHGYGTVSGLQVVIMSTDAGPTVTVSPGVALGPRGNEILVSQPVQWPLPVDGDVAYLCIRWAEREIEFIPAPGSGIEGDKTVASRIEEVAEFKYEAVPCKDGIALARLLKSRGIWKLDKRFHVRQVRV
jgi:hypothetical protein